MNEIRQILCPVDQGTGIALVHAQALARQQRAVVTALHLVPAPMLVGVGRSSQPDHGWTHGDPEVLRLERLRGFVGPARAGDVGVQMRIEPGEGVPGILEQAAATRADILVWPCHPGSDGGALDDTTRELLARATLPVLTISPRCRPPRDVSGFRQTLCGLDLSPASLPSLRWAADLAWNAEARTRLLLVHVLEGFPSEAEGPDSVGVDLGPYHVYREEVARTSLAELAAAHARGSGTELFVATGTPWLEILDLAASRGVDLIVIGAHGDGSLAGHVGCTADRLVCEAPCPVLVVPRGGP